MAPSSFIAPLGGYNAAAIDYVAPQTNYGTVLGYDKKDGTGTAWWGINNSTQAPLFDRIREYTNSAGVDVDSLLVRDGAWRLLNNVMALARNAAGSADVSLFKLNASDQLQFGLAFDIYRTTFTPASYTTNNSGSWTSVSLNPSLYIPIGKLLFVNFTALGTIAGSPTEIYAAMPAGMTAAIDKQCLACNVYNSGTQEGGSAAISTGGNTIVIKRASGAAFSNAAGSGATVSGFIILS